MLDYHASSTGFNPAVSQICYEVTALNFKLISIWSSLGLPLAVVKITSDHRYGLQIKSMNCNATQVLKHSFHNTPWFLQLSNRLELSPAPPDMNASETRNEKNTKFWYLRIFFFSYVFFQFYQQFHLFSLVPVRNAHRTQNVVRHSFNAFTHTNPKHVLLIHFLKWKSQ
jgi:hypothetical protein